MIIKSTADTMSLPSRNMNDLLITEPPSSGTHYLPRHPPPVGTPQHDSYPPARARSVTPSNDGKSSATPNKTQTIFIHKLYDMLEDESISHLIRWCSNNVSFTVFPGEEFSKVLALYFKHTNIASFIRQLNMYGFHKVNDNFNMDDNNINNLTSSSSPTTKWEFRHSTNQFKKGDLESLKLIKRRSSKNTNSHKEVVNLKSIPTSTSIPPENDDVLRTQYTPTFHHDQPLNSPIAQSPFSNMSPSRVPSDDSIPQSSEATNTKIDLATLNNKYDLILKELKSNQLDMIKLIDIVENLVKAGPSVEIDRSRTKTPITNLTDDVNTSPMSKPHINHSSSANASNTPTTSTDTSLADLRISLVSRFNNQSMYLPQFQHHIPPPPPPASRPSQPHVHHPPAQVAHHPAPIAHHPAPAQNQYHLSEVSARYPSTSNIVPQHYPLNPNYTIYNHEISFKNVKLNERSPIEPINYSTNRHSSVLMDPLQPIPMEATRSPATIKTYQQYPFPVMTQQSSHPVTEPPHYEQLRTNSLPNFEHSRSNEHLKNYQRHSLTDNIPPTSLSKSPILKHELPRSVPIKEPEDAKNVLPSVSELDKSIKKSSSMTFLLNADSDESQQKKRRL